MSRFQGTSANRDGVTLRRELEPTSRSRGAIRVPEVIGHQVRHLIDRSRSRRLSIAYPGSPGLNTEDVGGSRVETVDNRSSKERAMSPTTAVRTPRATHDRTSLRSSGAGHRTSPWRTQLRWFAAGAFAAFLVPFVFSSALDLHHDLYLVVYFAFVASLLGLYARAHGEFFGEFVGARWRWSLLVGLALLIPVIRNVLAEDATAHPDGAYFVFELVWRGAIYGAVDALLLTVFPCLIVYSALRGNLKSLGRKATYAVASLLLIATMTATYHLGYEQYREDGVGAPETGNLIFSIPTLATANPVGSVLVHSAMHVTAVSHEYEGEVRLPPTTSAD